MDPSNALRQSAEPYSVIGVCRLFEARAAEAPNAPAVEHGGAQPLSYADLNARANQFARYLHQRGIAQGDRIGLSLPRSSDQIIALLGSIKSGAAVVPLDPGYPAARRRFIVRDAAAKLIVSPAATEASGSHVLPWDVAYSQMARLSDRNLDDTATPGDLLYLLYTSGSTGRPKGVMMEHASLHRLVRWQIRTHGEDVRLRTLQYASLNFDVAFQEIFATLCAGATLVLVDNEIRRDGRALYHYLREQNIERLFVPYVALQQVATAALHQEPASGLRHVLTAGEALVITPAIRELFKRLPQCRLSNQYGPTESHVVSEYRMPSNPEAWVSRPPIGSAVAGAELYVLDDQLQPVAPGATGQLHIAGPCLARGYWGNDELTARRFVRHPESGARLYATGDMVLLNQDGQLDFRGRNDDQVKIRGHRVELGEIEARLSAVEGVEAAAVIAVEDASAMRQLRAFYSSGRTLASQEVHSALAAELPDYMLPTRCEQLPELPLTPTHKIDRLALMQRAAGGSGSLDPGASNEPGRTIAALWQQLLDIPQPDADQHFFRMGGHSLLATQLLVRIEQQLGITLSLSQLQAGPTLGELIACAERQPRGDDKLPTIRPDPANRHTPFALTDVQQAYWLGRHDVFELGNIATHYYAEVDSTALDPDRLEAAWRLLVQRHDMLRAVVRPDGTQQVLEHVPDYQFTRHDWRECDADREANLHRLREQLSHQVLAADRWPLFDLHLSLLGRNLTRIHLSFDILIIDALSLHTLMDEWHQLYRNPSVVLPSLPAYSFRDYVCTERNIRDSARYEAARAYWSERLSDLPSAPDLPLACTPASIRQPRFKRYQNDLQPDQWISLQRQASDIGLTPSALLLAVFAEVLSTWSHQPRFTINLTLFNRLPLHPDIDRLVGDFTSIIFLPLDTTERSFGKLAQQIQTQLWQNLDQRHYSGVEVLRELNRRSAGTRLQSMPVVFTSTLGLQGPGQQSQGVAQFGEEVFALSQTSQTWLDHQVTELNGGLRYCWDVLDTLFPPGVIQAMLDCYHARLLELANSREAWLAPRRLPLPAEQVARRRTVNATDAALSGLCLHDLVWQRAQLAPNSTAVITRDGQMSYGQLRNASFALGQQLLDAGVMPGNRVLLALRKGWREIVATLACSSTRAVYVPVDPEQPAARLKHILEQTQPRAILAEKALTWAAPTPVLQFDAALSSQQQDHALPVQGCSPDDVAYIIYTSGSTGVPKGVVIDHRGAVNTVLDINQRFGIRPTDRLFGLSSLNFDLSVYDIFGVLAAGAALVLPAPEELKDPVRWAQQMREHRVTVWNTVPALLQMLLEYLQRSPGNTPGDLRLAMLSGDWLPLTQPESAREHWPTLELYSLGGATEASIWSIYYPVERVDAGWPSIPYGQPLTNQRFYVLDSELNDRPDWVTGELYIGGIGLARGYWRDETQTSARFIEHPVSGERLYRTGDLGCYLPDGNIRFQGRADSQVKISGHRIELGEIASVLRQAPGMTAAEVVVSDQHIVGFVHSAGSAPDVAMLRDWCSNRLPAYMLPKLILAVLEWPLSANGKLDTRRLHQQAEQALRNENPVRPPRPPDNQLESKIAELWREVLQRTTAVSCDENFFEAGGNSLLATRLYNQLQDAFPTQRQLSVVSIFQYPTVALQARLLGQGGHPATPTTRGTDRRRRLQVLAPNAGRTRPADI